MSSLTIRLVCFIQWYNGITSGPASAC